MSVNRMPQGSAGHNLDQYPTEVDPRTTGAGRVPAQALGAIRAGLANGSMLRRMTEREAWGTGKPPTWGDILLPDQVDSVTPPLGRGQTALA